MKTKTRKGQGSIEFLMTYSWALVLVIIVIVVAWRWGVFSFSETIEPDSYGFWGVTPVDFKMTSGGQLTLSLHNGVGANVTVRSVRAIMGEHNNTVSDLGVGVIEPGKRMIVNVPNLVSGGRGHRFDVFIMINYSNAKMLEDRERLSSGTIWGSYE